MVLIIEISDMLSMNISTPWSTRGLISELAKGRRDFGRRANY
jgi:hypothetical protein